MCFAARTRQYFASVYSVIHLQCTLLYRFGLWWVGACIHTRSLLAALYSRLHRSGRKMETPCRLNAETHGPWSCEVSIPLCCSATFALLLMTEILPCLLEILCIFPWSWSTLNVLPALIQLSSKAITIQHIMSDMKLLS